MNKIEIASKSTDNLSSPGKNYLEIIQHVHGDCQMLKHGPHPRVVATGILFSTYPVSVDVGDRMQPLK